MLVVSEMPKRPEGGIELVRWAVAGRRVTAVEPAGDGEVVVLEFEGGFALALSGRVGVVCPQKRTAELGDAGDWGL